MEGMWHNVAGRQDAGTSALGMGDFDATARAKYSKITMYESGPWLSA
jgi:hypothetical protein